jgi:hypothetical protein
MCCSNIAPIHLSLEEVSVHAGCNVLMEVDGNTLLIVGDLQDILDQQVRLHLIQILDFIFII